MNRPRLRQSLLGIFLIPMVLIMGWLVFQPHGPANRAIAALRYPFQMDNVEGYLLAEAVELWRGHSIYRPIQEPPYLVANYPPLYQLAMGGLIRSQEPNLSVGRALTISALVGAAVALILIAMRAGRQALPALLAPLLFVPTMAVHNWLAYVRVDIPALFLSLLGLTAFMTERSRLAKATSLLLFWLAAMTKQTALIAPAACTLFLLLRDWRKGLAYGAIFAAGLASLYGALTLITGGEFWRHTIVYNANAMEWHKVWGIWLPHLWRFYPWLILAAGGCLAFAVFRWKWPGAEMAKDETDQTSDGQNRQENEHRAKPDWSFAERSGLLVLFFLLAAGSLLSLAKAGSAENYLIEPLAALALFVAALLGRMLWESANLARPWASRWFAALILILLAFHAGHYFRADAFGMHRFEQIFWRFPPGRDVAEQGIEVVREITTANGTVISEDPMFALYDDRLPYINPFILSQLAREGTWDQRPFLAQILQGDFALIITTRDLREPGPFDRYTDEMADAVRSNYVLYKTYRGSDDQIYFLFRPKDQRADLRRIVTASRTGEIRTIY